MNKPLKCTNRASEVTSCILQLGGGGGGSFYNGHNILTPPPPTTIASFTNHKVLCIKGMEIE